VRWFENNPMGVALASVCGLLLLVSAGLGYVWSRPAASGADAPAQSQEFDVAPSQSANDLGPLTDYREVTERPLFDESRQPAVAIDGEGIDLDDLETEIAGAPEVTLSGVVITPEMKLVTLRPIASGEPLIAREGEELQGDYYGWTVSAINPRGIVLESRDGDNLELPLNVNTREIEQPPEPAPAEGEEEVASADTAEDGELTEKPLSRAEEIRQRIAERREELRRQAESGGGNQRGRRSNETAYQAAIENMINRGRQKNETDDDEEDGDGSDG
jgi:hypothetical protein